MSRKLATSIRGRGYFKRFCDKVSRVLCNWNCSLQNSWQSIPWHKRTSHANPFTLMPRDCSGQNSSAADYLKTNKNTHNLKHTSSLTTRGAVVTSGSPTVLILQFLESRSGGKLIWLFFYQHRNTFRDLSSPMSLLQLLSRLHKVSQKAVTFLSACSQLNIS